MCIFNMETLIEMRISCMRTLGSDGVSGAGRGRWLLRAVCATGVAASGAPAFMRARMPGLMTRMNPLNCYKIEAKYAQTLSFKPNQSRNWAAAINARPSAARPQLEINVVILQKLNLQSQSFNHDVLFGLYRYFPDTWPHRPRIAIAMDTAGACSSKNQNPSANSSAKDSH